MANWLTKWVVKSLGGTLNERASIEAIGNPNQAAPGNTEDQTVAGEIPALVGPAAQKLKFTRKEIPKPDAPDLMVAYIKQWRAQLRIRPVLTELSEAIVDGFRLRGEPEVELWAARQRLYAKVARIALELSTIGWCVVYVSEDPKAPPTLTILHNVSVKRDVYGQEVIYLQLSDDAKAAVKLYPQAYPAYWAQQIDNPSGINITRMYGKPGAAPDGTGKAKLTQGGAYFITIEGDAENTLPIPPVYPYLADASDAERASDSMGSIVDAIKYYLIHAKVGNKEGADKRDGREKPPSTSRLKDVFNSLSMGFRAGALVTPSDVDVEMKVLDKNPFAITQEHQRSVVYDLRKNVGRPDFEQASSEGAAMFMARGFLPSMNFIRYACIVDQFLKQLIADLAASNRIKGIENARILFSDAGIQDLGALINKAKFMHSTGAYSLQEVCETIDPNYDLQRSLPLKQIEQDNSELIGNIYEMAQGVSGHNLELDAEKMKAAAKAAKAKPAGGAPAPGAAQDTPKASPQGDTGGKPPK